MRKRSKTHPGLSPKGIEQNPKELYTGAVLYYEGHDAFKNKYGKICVKPVLIELRKYDAREFTGIKNIYIKHQQILDMFDGFFGIFGIAEQIVVTNGFDKGHNV